MKLPREVRRRFQAYGRTGGRARAERMTPEERRRVARRAVLCRWTRARFGADSFAPLGMPGGDVIDAGLEALMSGSETVESLVVSLAAPRLRREGVPVPAATLRNADTRLYRLLEETAGELAHARYLAHLRQVASFCDACRHVRRHSE